MKSCRCPSCSSFEITTKLPGYDTQNDDAICSLKITVQASNPFVTSTKIFEQYGSVRLSCVQVNANEKYASKGPFKEKEKEKIEMS